MELDRLLEERRSIRSFAPDVRITREELDELIKAVQMAPSWANTQTGRYYIACSPGMAEKVKGMLLGRNQENCANVPVYIVTAFEKGRAGFRQETPVNELGDQWGAYDLGLAASYLILKARDMGYDTLIMGVRNADELRAALSIPENEQIASVIALGKRAAEPNMPKHKEPDEIAKFF